MESKSDFYQLFSAFIVNEKSDLTSFHQLNCEAPILRPLLPSMIRNLCHFMQHPDFELDPGEGPYFFKHFEQVSSAQLHSPEVPVRPMRVWEVFQFRQSLDAMIIFDCQELGATLVSKNPLVVERIRGACALCLEPFFCYAFSNDLWGEDGKWSRFHARLITLLNNKSILIDSRGPGHYQLQPRAAALEKWGVKGSYQDNSYHLFLPWSYPLMALNELEKIISLEF